MITDITTQGIDFLSSLFIFFVGLFVLLIVVVFIRDVSQSRDAIRRNYPVIGRFRYVFSTLGEFFRQYFFAMDREEMPFNRAEREWVYKTASGKDNTMAFGSTKNLTPPGTPLFVNTTFPTLDEHATQPPPIIIGPQCPHPYEAKSLINVSAMSYGALSKPAIRALSRGAKLAGCWLNTGEGGLAPYHLEGGCDLVFQIGTAKYGVRNAEGQLDDDRLREIASNPQVRMFEIKISQGAKPGKGGILPGTKVTPEIALIRGIAPGMDSISPNRHIEISDTGELLDFVQHVREVTGKPTGFKMVVGDEDWIKLFCSEIHQRGIESAPDFMTIDSCDGGTGAAPMPLMDDVGLPIKESLPMVVDVLTQYGLRDRIRVIASGKLITPSGVAWALCAGADFVNSARGFMFSLGCIQALKCNRNTCPTGITTHDRRLQKGLNPAEKAVKIKNFVDKIHYGTALIAHSCGVPHQRALTRAHCRIVQPDGKSTLMRVLYPRSDVLPEYHQPETEPHYF
ncbi:FMN-binding glutamate synthase family protein [Sulfuriflexus sp.]|uniref:FMN-binding glutamate synthase family protein n=1 Tax=Sulfuriflexus sp. TaxID=2015443 RepID=UPI0028CE848D|nr:FMN-binding glutamate synthase family protein [Sulfuriflexus sp.]MDT8405395.1 FMN-binding glutamate synthase family protein [Sulfuriflexus sp.]